MEWALIGLTIGYVCVIFTGMGILGKYARAMIEMGEKEDEITALRKQLATRPGRVPEHVFPTYDDVHAVMIVAARDPHPGQDYAPGEIPCIWMNAKDQRSWKRGFDYTDPDHDPVVWNQTQRVIGRHDVHHMLISTDKDTFVHCTALHVPGMHETVEAMGADGSQMDLVHHHVLDAFWLANGKVPHTDWTGKIKQMTDPSDPMEDERPRRATVLDL